MADPQRTREKITTAVQQLVSEAADSDKASRVSRIAFDPGQSKMTWPSHWPHDAIFRPGSYCTDRYMVVDFIGRGGIAEIYEARDMLDEVLVALKVVRTNGASPDVLGKVAAEARTLKVVQHRNVLRVFDAGYLARDGLLFFTMERLLGATLHDLIYRSVGARRVPREPALPLLQVVRMGIGIARGVNALHELRIFHRDIKPENLFYTRDGELKVFDLDVAKFSSMCQLRTTQPGFTMGTVLYMSPELLQHGTTTARGDIYAIGLVLFELVAGHHAFADDPDQILAQADVIAWHAARTPPRLSQRIAGVPIAFDAIVRKCVEKDPSRRFQTCSELSDKLGLLEELLLRAEAASPAPVRPDVVIQAEGTAVSPRLPHATTANAATGLPATPYEILPPPLFDEAPPVRASVPPSVERAASVQAAAPSSVERAALVPPTRRSGATEGEERGATSGVRPTEDALVEQAPRPGPVTMPASHPRGPRGTEIMPTTRRPSEAPSSAPVSAGGTERMVEVASPRSAAAPGEMALPSVEEALASMGGPAPSKVVAAPREAAGPALVAEVAQRPPTVAPARIARRNVAARPTRERGRGWVYVACVLAGMLVPTLAWMVAGLRGREVSAPAVAPVHGGAVDPGTSTTSASSASSMTTATTSGSATVTGSAEPSAVEPPSASVEAPSARVAPPVVRGPSPSGGARTAAPPVAPSGSAGTPSAGSRATSAPSGIAWPRNAGAPRSTGKRPAIPAPKSPVNDRPELYLEP